ncbi:MAG: pilus assembly protein TadG-related protein [Armatimonadota bacterium]|nr:pilus assembly protein TadG-related protein [Armatimonadota bacterium]MDR5703212.1 pilus assembly protein TadG-related protein [Armatimonadota bacterium]MDR7435509.1 pilus assembly protein TadG-related protein [Armatimonadota bacterium]
MWTLHRSEHGGVLVFGAILLVPLMGLAAFAVDWGYLLQVRWILQSAVDAGIQSGRAYSQTGRTWGDAWLKAMAGAYEVARENIRKNGIQDFRVWTEREGTQLKVYAEAPVSPLFGRILGVRTVLVRAGGQTTIIPSTAVGPQEAPEVSSFPTVASPPSLEVAAREFFRERELEVTTNPSALPRATPSQGRASPSQPPRVSQGSEGSNPPLSPGTEMRSPQPSSTTTDDWAYPGSTFVFIQEQRDEQTSYLGLDRSTGEVQRLRGQVGRAPDSRSGSGGEDQTSRFGWYME